MKRKFFIKSYFNHSKKGVIVLLLMIVTGAIILTVALGIAFSSVNSSQISLYQGNSNRMFLNLDGCVEEALGRVNRNNLYAGGTVTIDNTSCTISITGTNPTHTVNVTATNGDYTRKVQVVINIFPTVSITSWQELTS